MAKKHVVQGPVINKHPEWAKKTAETNALLNTKEKKGISIKLIWFEECNFKRTC